MEAFPELRPALGNYAAGDRFWDREREVREVTAYLTDGTSVLITGPRRVGKTSVVRRVLDGMAPARTVFVDVEHHASPTELFASLGAAASGDAGTWKGVRGWFGRRIGDLADRIEGLELGMVKIQLQAAMGEGWRNDASAIVRALAGGDGPAFVAIDELPLLVNRVLKHDPAEAELLMATLRSLADELPTVRWLVSGSIGLEPVLHRAGLTGLVSQLRSYPIDAWDEATTIGAVEALARTMRLVLAPGASAAAHAALGLGVPFHVQLLMDEVGRDAERRGDRRVAAADIERVYAGPFLTGAVRASMLHLESRLVTVLGEGDSLRLARDLLTQAAVAEPLTTGDGAVLAADLIESADQRPPILREALEILEHDAYLQRHPDGWRFRSRLVADWWRQGNELGFVPAAERPERDR